mgnify:FL=1
MRNLVPSALVFYNMSHSAHHSVPDRWYLRLLARFYDPIMRPFERRFAGPRRRELLHGLQGRVLEVGAGTGANFDHYPPGVSVLAIEPSAAMLRRAAEKREALPAGHADIRLLHAGIGDPEVAAYVPEKGFDAIVLTLVLCTIPDPRAAIATLHAWLCPGGRLYVLEHIINESQPGRALQQCADPVWTQMAAGCHLTRPTDELLKQGGFRPEWETYYQRGLRFYQAVMKPAGSREK